MALAAERLSRFLTFLLRHKPKDYPLAIDSEGFALWQDVVDLVQQRFFDVTEGQMRALIAGAEKKRFEILGDKVRATYGHSFPVDLGGSLAEPPAELYFAAARDLAESMLQRGLEPRDRQYVHLSVTAEEAESVARKNSPPVRSAIRRSRSSSIWTSVSTVRRVTAPVNGSWTWRLPGGA